MGLQHRVQCVVELRILFEVDAPYKLSMRSRIMDRINNALGGINHVDIAYEFVDEEGRRLRKSELGKMSPAMVTLMIAEFNEDEPAVSA